MRETRADESPEPPPSSRGSSAAAGPLDASAAFLDPLGSTHQFVLRYGDLAANAERKVDRRARGAVRVDGEHMECEPAGTDALQ